MAFLPLARVDWDAVSGVSGIVSALVAVVSLFLLFRGKQQDSIHLNHAAETILHYLLFCSSWVMLVIAANWIFEPFGPYLTKGDERKLYGAMISAPALILSRYALNRLIKGTRGNSS